MLNWLQTKMGMRTLIIILAIALVLSIIVQLAGSSDLAGLLTGTVSQVDREDPLIAFRFALEIEGKLSGYFTSVSGIGSTSEVIEERVTTQTGETLIRANPGRLSWTPVTLQRGITSNLDVWEWRQLVIDGNVEGARTDCAIVAYNQANEEIARWNLTSAWPSSLIGPAMQEESANYMVEQVVIVHEGMVRVQ